MSLEMWVEKYRPKTLKDVKNQAEIVSRLQEFVKMRTMPHCLFAGPPGTGKTTAALALAHDLFGERFMAYFMELNASDERGINVIREKVKTFARMRALGEKTFKIMVLDEADNMTSDAQQALRRTMERYTKTCRFILICNYSGKIIEPIQSRCAIFRFTPLSNKDIADYLQHIVKNEGITITDDGIQALIDVCEGDMRKAINTLQASASLGKLIDEKTIYTVVGRAQPREIYEMLILSLQGNFIEAREKLRTILHEYGLSGSDVIKQIHGEIFKLNIPENQKVSLADIVGEIDYRLIQGADEEIQLSSLLARFGLIGDKMKGRS